MADINDKLLIDRCKRGDRDAFDMLVRTYEKRVYNLAYRLSGNYDEAQDIVGDSFIRVFQALKMFRGDANFSTWLFRIVTNVYLDAANAPATSSTSLWKSISNWMRTV